MRLCSSKHISEATTEVTPDLLLKPEKFLGVIGSLVSVDIRQRYYE
jgi:hypothetical protein